MNGIILPTDKILLPSTYRHIERMFQIMQKKKLLTAILYSATLAVSVALIASAHLINISASRPASAYEQTYTAISDSKGNVTVFSPYNNLTVSLDEYGEILDLKVAQKDDRVFYIVKENGKSTLVSRRLSSLVYDKLTLCENVSSYLISSDASTALVLTTDSSLKYLTLKRNKVSVTDLAADVSELILSDDGSSVIYTSASSVFSYDQKNGSQEIISDSSVVHASKDLSSLLVKKGSSLVFCDLISGKQNIISSSLDSLLFADDDTIYYTEKTDNENKLAIFLSDTSASSLVSDNVCNTPFVGTSPILVYTEYKNDLHLDELSYHVLVDKSINGITTLSGSEYSGFAQNDDGTLLFMNDVSKDQALLVRASVKDNTLSAFTVVDTDVKQLCGILGDSIVYIKNFSPVARTADLCCNGKQLRSVDILDIDLAPSTNIRPLRTYEWVNQGIKYSSIACVETITGSHVIYQTDNITFAFDGENEFILSSSGGNLKSTTPLIGDAILCLNTANDSVTVLANGKVSSLPVRANKVITVTP